MKTTPQNADAAGTSNNAPNGSPEEPKVIVDPSVMAEGTTQAGDAKVGTTEAMPIPPVADGATQTPPAAHDTLVDVPAGPGPAEPAAAAAPNANADNGAAEGKDEEDKLPTNDAKGLKYGLAAAAVLGVIALFAVAFMVARNSVVATPSVTVPASAPAPAGPLPLPEVRTPAPRLIDATGCRRGQYRVEGNQLVFTNCATLELAEPAR